MSTNILIRTYQPGDLPQAESLNRRVKPYRPEDQPEVEAMTERARIAKEKGERWRPLPPPLPDVAQTESTSLAFWVAVSALDDGQGDDLEEIVGMVGVYPFDADAEMPPEGKVSHAWLGRDDVADLRRLRVAPEYWRQGVGRGLNQAAIEWCRENGFRTLVVNTTAAQLPALGLYTSLGFQEVDRSFVDRYEMVWMELIL